MKLYTMRYRILRRLRLALNNRTLKAAYRLGRMQAKCGQASNPKLPIYEIVPLTPQAEGPFVWVDKTHQRAYQQGEKIDTPHGTFFGETHQRYLPDAPTVAEMPTVKPAWLNELVQQQEQVTERDRQEASFLNDDKTSFVDDDETELRMPVVKKRKAG